MPALLNLPIYANDGERLTSLALLNYAAPYLTLHGDAGCGGSLLLLQIAMHCAIHNRTDPVLYLPLATMDIPDHPPRFILEKVLRQTGLPNPFMNRIGTNGHNWVVLIDQWDDLPHTRRAVWRSFLQSLPYTWQDARILVALPAMEEEWSHYDSIILASPTPAYITQWLHHLLPEQPAVVDDLQTNDQTLALIQSLFDVVLLALCAETAIPTTRTMLYQQGLERWQAIQAKHPHDVPIALWHNNLTHAQLALRMATTGDMAALMTLDDEQRADVAVILASLLPNPATLYSSLWSNGYPTLENALILGRCLLQYPQREPAWILPILETLVAKKSTMPHRQLVQALGTMLPTLFMAAGDALPAERASVLLKDIAALIPKHTLLAILDTPAFPAALRWAAAEVMQQQHDQHALPLYTQKQPPDILAQAARCTILALGNTTSRRMLATPEAAGWIVALRDGAVTQQRRLQVASALLNDHAIPAVLRATALVLLSQSHDDTTLTILKRICTDHDSSVRYAALAALRNREPRQALWVLHEIMLIDHTSWDIRRDGLKQLAVYPQKEAGVLLARCTLSTTMPLAGRIQALYMLRERGNHGISLLHRILRVETAHPVVRAVAALLLGRIGDREASEELFNLAIFSKVSLLRQQAIQALIAIGEQHPTDHQFISDVSNMLLAALNTPHYDTELTICMIQALGKLPDALETLQQVLATEQGSQLKQAWLESIPHLSRIPVSQWEELALPEEHRIVLLSALTEGTTDGEQPGSLEELTEQAASRVRVAAAQAMVATKQPMDTARRDTVTKQTIRQSLLTAIHQAPSHKEARQLLATLVQISDTAGLTEMEGLLNDPSIDSSLRWLAIEQLGTNSAALPLLLHYLEQETLDPFTRGTIVKIPGLHQHSHALPILCRLATRHDLHEHLRLQVIQALQPAHDQATVSDTLFALVCDDQVPPTLRSAAASALPPDLHTTRLHSLREILRRPHTPTELLEGLIVALGQTRDHEALALILRYAESPHTGVALAALLALASMGDDRVAPTLVRIAQNTAKDQSIRLQAVITLLRLCGEEYLPFLRSFLDSPLLPLQLQALDELLSAWTNYAQPLILVANRHAPLALRLRALDEVARRQEYHNVLSDLLLDTNEPPQLRSHIALLLGHTGGRDSVDALSRCVYQEENSLILHRRCIHALMEQAQSSRLCADEAYLVLGHLAEESVLSEACRIWAAQALVAIAVQK
jgi:HEAT repeat protein